MSSGTHSFKRERAAAEGFGGQNGECKSAEFLFQCRAARSPSLKSISLAHPPSIFQAVPSGIASASAFNDGLHLQVSPPFWSCRVLFEGTILALYVDSPFTHGFTGRVSGHWDIHFFTFVSSRVCPSLWTLVPPAGPRLGPHLWRFLRRVSFLAPLSSCFP